MANLSMSRTFDLIAGSRDLTQGVFIPNVYIDFTGDRNSATLLAQLVYWQQRAVRDDGFIYKTHDELFKETRLSKHQIQKAKNKLVELGLLEVKFIKANGVPTNHYRIIKENYVKSINDFMEKPTCEKLAGRGANNCQVEVAEISNSLTESTTENTNNINNTVVEDNLVNKQVIEIIEYLNKATNKHGTRKAFKTNGKGNIKFAKQALEVAKDVDEIKKVIDYKTKEWFNSPREKYLRPETLFRTNKYKEYLTQAKRGYTFKPKSNDNSWADNIDKPKQPNESEIWSNALENDGNDSLLSLF